MDNISTNSNGFLTLSFCELFERISYYGVFSILILKLHQSFQLNDSESFAIFGIFAALSYATLMLGGYLADKYIGVGKAILIGGILIITGNILLAFHNLHIFQIGLAALIMGTALFKVNCTSLVGTLYSNNKRKRERAYTVFYCAMNIGGMLGPLLYGIIAISLGWSWCFILSALLVFIALITFILNKKIVVTEKKREINILALLPILFTVAVLSILFIFPEITNYAIVVFFIAAIFFFIKILVKSASTTRKHLLGLFLLSFFCIFFFACSLQVATSITLFVQRDIYRAFIPTSAFTSLDPLFVVIMAPIPVLAWKFLAKKNLEPFITTKIAIGLLLAFFAFLSLSVSANYSGIQENTAAIVYLVISYICLGAGEICLTPAVLAKISELSPINLKSTIMGSWFLFIAIAGFIAGQLSKLSDYSGKLNSATIYHHAFIEIGIFALIAAIIIYLTKPFMKSLFEKH